MHTQCHSISMHAVPQHKRISGHWALEAVGTASALQRALGTRGGGQALCIGLHSTGARSCVDVRPSLRLYSTLVLFESVALVMLFLFMREAKMSCPS